jgi:hypothetical protein
MLAAAGAAAACEGLDVSSPVAAVMVVAILVAVLTAAAEWAWPAGVGPADGDSALRAAGGGAVMAVAMVPECVLGTAVADVTAARA